MEQESIEQRFRFVGEGELPAEFDRVNWGAFGFAPIWSLLYGPRRWAWAIWILFLGPIVINNIAILWFDSRTTYPAVRSVVDPVSMFIALPLSALYAYRVDRSVWARAAAHMAAFGQVPSDAIPLGRYSKSRRFWTRLFVVWATLVVVANLAAVLGSAFLGHAVAPSYAVGVGLVLLAFDIKRRQQSRA